jgi:hypothetical protein
LQLVAEFTNRLLREHREADLMANAPAARQ